jgi:hypothetical protein
LILGCSNHSVGVVTSQINLFWIFNKIYYKNIKKIYIYSFCE